MVASEENCMGAHADGPGEQQGQPQSQDHDEQVPNSQEPRVLRENPLLPHAIPYDHPLREQLDLDLFLEPMYTPSPAQDGDLEEVMIVAATSYDQDVIS